jgi:hypothetical protein
MSATLDEALSPISSSTQAAARPVSTHLRLTRQTTSDIKASHEMSGYSGFFVTCLGEMERTTGFEPATLTLAT